VNEHDTPDVIAALAGERRDRFADGFADRAVQRWRSSLNREPDLASVMGRQARRLVPLAAAATVLLALNNLRHRASGQSAIAAVFGVTTTAPARTIVSIDELYDLTTYDDRR
jgi:hypothetical protein